MSARKRARSAVGPQEQEASSPFPAFRYFIAPFGEFCDMDGPLIHSYSKSLHNLAARSVVSTGSRKIGNSNDDFEYTVLSLIIVFLTRFGGA